MYFFSNHIHYCLYRQVDGDNSMDMFRMAMSEDLWSSTDEVTTTLWGHPSFYISYLLSSLQSVPSS